MRSDERSRHLYTRDLVETLIPAIWDEAYCYGLPRPESAPDPDMPKSWKNKKTGNTFWAYIADIKTAWTDTPDLTEKERRAVFLRHVFDFTHADIAVHEACDRSTVTHRLYRAIGKIVAHLNGGEFTEGDLPPDEKEHSYL